MASARLFAEMDVKFRDLDLQERGLENVTRPLGGMKLLVVR